MKISNAVSTAIVVLFSSVAAPAVSSGPEPRPDETVHAEFPVRWMEVMTAAYADFKKARSDISCFNLDVRKEGDQLVVVISPPLDIRVDGDQISIPVVPGDSRCGRGISYYFDRAGRLVKRVVAR